MKRCLANQLWINTTHIASSQSSSADLETSVVCCLLYISCVVWSLFFIMPPNVYCMEPFTGETVYLETLRGSTLSFLAIVFFYAIGNLIFLRKPEEIHVICYYVIVMDFTQDYFKNIWLFSFWNHRRLQKSLLGTWSLLRPDIVKSPMSCLFRRWEPKSENWQSHCIRLHTFKTLYTF